MAPEPQRREQRRTHLDASVVPVERALLARARRIEARAASLTSDEEDLGAQIKKLVLRAVEDELVDLAEELHWWG